MSLLHVQPLLHEVQFFFSSSTNVTHYFTKTCSQPLLHGLNSSFQQPCVQQFLLSSTTAPLSSESPPSYEQLFGVGRMREQVKDARTTSSNNGTFAIKFCDIVCSSGTCVYNDNYHTFNSREWMGVNGEALQLRSVYKQPYFLQVTCS